MAEVVSRRELVIKGLKSTRCGKLLREDTTLWKAIPITSPPRTLSTSRPWSARGARAACHEAAVKYRTTPRHVEAVLKRKPNATGAAKLRAIIAGEQKVTLSQARASLSFSACKRMRAAAAADQRRRRLHTVDCRWPEHRLNVELNSYCFTRAAWRGSATTSASGRRETAATSFVASRGPTSSRPRPTCGANSGSC